MTKKLRIAFMGFRHGHIFNAYQRFTERPDTEIAAACEEDAATRTDLNQAGKVRITHDNFSHMLRDVAFDVLAVGDYYGRRGAIMIKALEQGKHVISDKPIATSLTEMERIEALAARQRLVIGCQLDLRDSGLFREARKMVRAGEIGEIHAVAFGGQHPLGYGTRPAWYFEQGKHGGTLNDIAIHAMDFIPWVTGLQFKTINAARNWNARLKAVPWFNDAAQVMLTLENNGGVLGDVSYFWPDTIGNFPYYWHVMFWGSDGVLVISNMITTLTIFKKGEKEGRNIQYQSNVSEGIISSFINEIRGQTESLSLSSAEVLRASRLALMVQNAADQNLTNVAL